MTLVIGLGNPLRRDDGVGYRAALELEQQGLPALAVCQLLPELADRLAQTSQVLFLDADLSLRPGTIYLRRLAQPEAGVLSHGLSPAGLLQLSLALYGHAPAAYLLSMGISDLGYGEGFSLVVEAAFPAFLQLAQSLCSGARWQ